MNRFVAREKLSKKERRQLDNQQRRTWEFSPTTKKIDSKKLYNRHRKTREIQNDWIRGFFSLEKKPWQDPVWPCRIGKRLEIPFLTYFIVRKRYNCLQKWKMLSFYGDNFIRA